MSENNKDLNYEITICKQSLNCLNQVKSKSKLIQTKPKHNHSVPKRCWNQNQIICHINADYSTEVVDNLEKRNAKVL